MTQFYLGNNCPARSRMVAVNKGSEYYLVHMIVVRSPYSRYFLNSTTRIIVEHWTTMVSSGFGFISSGIYDGLGLDLSVLPSTWSGKNEAEWESLALLAVGDYLTTHDGVDPVEPNTPFSRYKRPPSI